MEVAFKVVEVAELELEVVVVVAVGVVEVVEVEELVVVALVVVGALLYLPGPQPAASWPGRWCRPPG